MSHTQLSQPLLNPGETWSQMQREMPGLNQYAHHHHLSPVQYRAVGSSIGPVVNFAPAKRPPAVSVAASKPKKKSTKTSKVKVKKTKMRMDAVMTNDKDAEKKRAPKKKLCPQL